MSVQELVVTCSKTPRKKAIVVSHERSGTHFLMNSLAANFGYLAIPWVNFDFELGLNFYSPRHLRGFFEKMHDESVLNIVKSHHGFEFYADYMEYMLEQFHVFYVYRSPLDVMASYWRLISSLDWDEGPRASSPGEFMRAAPYGGMLRYQKRQAETVLDRWRQHVSGWMLELPELVRDRVIYVRYDQLDSQFASTVTDLAARIDHPLAKARRPRRDHNVVVPTVSSEPNQTAGFTEEDEQFVQERAGELLATLGLRATAKPHGSKKVRRNG